MGYLSEKVWSLTLLLAFWHDIYEGLKAKFIWLETRTGSFVVLNEKVAQKAEVYIYENGFAFHDYIQWRGPWCALQSRKWRFFGFEVNVVMSHLSNMHKFAVGMPQKQEMHLFFANTIDLVLLSPQSSPGDDSQRIGTMFWGGFQCSLKSVRRFLFANAEYSNL